MKVPGIGLETTNSKPYTFGSNNPQTLKGKFETTITDSGLEVEACVFVTGKLKTGNLLS